MICHSHRCRTGFTLRRLWELFAVGSRFPDALPHDLEARLDELKRMGLLNVIGIEGNRHYYVAKYIGYEDKDGTGVVERTATGNVLLHATVIQTRAPWTVVGASCR